MTTRSEPRSYQRLNSLSDIKALMLESFKDMDLEGTLVKESSIEASFQRNSSRSVLSPNAFNGSSTRTTAENSAGNSPKRLSKSSSLPSLRTLGTFSRRATETGPYAEDRLPVLPISKRTSAKLKQSCEQAIEFLLKLQEPSSSRTSTSTDPLMPPTALNFSKGLAFIRQHKAGIVTSWVWGSGFVIARLGPGLWSAPCFLTDKFLSLGLTCGARTVDTCYAIPTNAGTNLFKAESINTSFDIGITLGVDPLAGDVPVATAQSADRTTGRYALRPPERPKVFSISDGIILDFSWRCGMHCIDDKVHKELYGDNVRPVDILSGKVQIPEEFKPFYQVLTKLAAEGDVVKPTVSLFAAEKEKNKLKAQSSLANFSFPHRKSGKLSSFTGSSDTESLNGDYGFTNGSINNSVGSQNSTAFSLPRKSSSPAAAEPASFNRLFADTELLDLDLDGPSTPKESGGEGSSTLEVY